MTKQIVVVLPLVKETKNRVKYADDNWASGPVCGNLYPLREVLSAAFGKFPKGIKITIEEIEQ